MHIDPSVVQGVKIALGFATGSLVSLVTVKSLLKSWKDIGILPTLMRAAVCSFLTLMFFEFLWSRSFGVSELHLIFGASLYLLFGFAPAAAGLFAGLLVQGMIFAPLDLPQFGMNITTLLVPLMLVAQYMKKHVPANTSYINLSYSQLLKMSVVYQGGIAFWVAFWVLYGNNFNVSSIPQLMTYFIGYLALMVFESSVNVALLFAVKHLNLGKAAPIFADRLYMAA